MTDHNDTNISESAADNGDPGHASAPVPEQLTPHGADYAQSLQPQPTYGHPAYPAPIGKVRSTGMCILLLVVTLGIYSYVWFYQTHEEMKRHKGTGLGGGIAVLLTFFVGFVMPYITSREVGELYERRGQQKPVSGWTGLWYFPGMFILIGPLVWFIKTNGALNSYWRSLGAH